mmetsp:Transcript_85927/g.179626  ORF Transcript_85927/g.179626 Transcript_85927/m.179626 type:complete len:212 (+) Transcript_85927:100-735(+)
MAAGKKEGGEMHATCLFARSASSHQYLGGSQSRIRKGTQSLTQAACSAEGQNRVHGEVVSTIQVLARDPLASEPMLLHLERPTLREDVVDGWSAVHVGVGVGLDDLVDWEAPVASQVTLESSQKHGFGHALVHVPHPGDLGPRVLALHGVKLGVQASKLALLELVAAARAVAQMGAPCDQNLAGVALFQHDPVAGPGASPRGASCTNGATL